MLKVSSEQLVALDEAWREEFNRQLAALFRENIPEVTSALAPEELLARIGAAHLKAVKYGIQTQRGISQFAGLSLTAGADFDETPAIRACLEKPCVNPDYTINLLVDQLASLQQS
jgi:hypothetical protein